jgi:hypothetical protein
VGTVLVVGTTAVGVNEAVVASGTAAAVIDGTTPIAGVVRTDVVMADETAPADVEILGVKEAITLTGFVGKRGITGAATVGVPVDAKTVADTDMLGADRFGDALDGDDVTATGTGDAAVDNDPSEFPTDAAVFSACSRAIFSSSGIVHFDCFVTLL